MITLSFCLHHKPGLTREAFQTYWRETHAPLVKRHAGALGIVRYEQLHALSDAVSDDIRDSRGAPGGYDGIALIGFASFEAMAAAATNPGFADGARALLEDERRFIDLARSPLWFNAPNGVVIDG